ncbi:twin-arginine translocation signal domain-containing protein, partial [Acinetobacter baumannii]
MTAFTRRHFLGTLAAAPLAAAMPDAWAQTGSLKISHQFPGGTLTDGDFRDRLVRMFAQQVYEKTKGALKFEIYPGSSL